MPIRLPGTTTTPISNSQHLERHATDKKKNVPQHTDVTANFQHPHKADGLEVKRQAVLSNLQDIHDHVQLLRMTNWSTNDMESVFDHMLLPLMTKAERSHNPDNHVVATLNGFENIQQHLDAPKTTLITNVPGQNHFVAVDIRNQDNKPSILVLDSVHADYYKDVDLEAMTHNMPPDAKASIICMETQNSNYGCRIFSLSTSSKISKSEDYMNALHNAHLSPQDQSFAHLLQSRKVKSQDGIDIYQHPGSIPASFLKHTQSRSRLKNDYPQQKEQLVNKKGQTLSERQEDRLVRREEIGISDDFQLRPNGRIFSASIEDKRLEYLGNAIDYIRDTDAQNIDQMTRLFEIMSAESLMPSQVGPQLEEREMGPHSVMQDRADELNEYLLFQTAPSSPEH